MSGILAMGSNKITGLGAPTLTDDAATKTYVDAKVNQVSSGATSPPTKWVFTGTAGADTTYSVTGAEVNGDTAYDVSVDGSVLEPTTDYTVDPDTDTLTIVNTLSGGEDIVVIERGFGIAVSDGVVGEDQLQNDAVTTDKIADHSVTAVKISNTDPIFNVQTTGEVGIGIESPDGPLHVYNTAANQLNLTRDINVIGISGGASAEIHGGALEATSPSMGGAIGFTLKDSDGTGSGGNTEGLIYFKTKVSGSSLTEAMRIDSSGNVGIGVTSPAANHKLHIKNTETANFRLERNKTGDTNTQNGYVQIAAAQGENIIYSKDLDGNDKDFVIDAGNVGIGTDSPDAKLEIVDSSNHLNLKVANTISQSVLKFSDSDGLGGAINYDHNTDKLHLITDGTALPSNGALNIDSSGNVGIGTVSPSAPLEVSSTTGGVVFPRLTTAQRDAISSPTDGETIFNTTNNQIESYNGSDWAVGGGGVSKYTTGWTNISSTLANDTEFTFTHNLGTTDILVNIYASTSSTGTAEVILVGGIDIRWDGTNQIYGAQIVDITNTTLKIRTGSPGWNKKTSGSFSTTNWNASYIKVVAVG
jgi:hypothetical protein